MDLIHSTCLRELSTDEKAKLGISSGIQYLFDGQQGEIRWNYNIGNGFIITVADYNPVRNLQEFLALIKTPRSFCVSGIYPDGTHQQYYIE